MLKRLKLAIAVLSLILTGIAPSYAQSACAEAARSAGIKWKTKCRAEHEMLLLEDRLKSTNSASWIGADVEAYLAKATWVVYYAYCLYS